MNSIGIKTMHFFYLGKTKSCNLHNTYLKSLEYTQNCNVDQTQLFNQDKLSDFNPDIIFESQEHVT